MGRRYIFFNGPCYGQKAFGQLHYVDITAAELAKFEQPHSKRILEHEPIAKNDWRTADPAIIARLKPLEAQRDHAHDAPGLSAGNLRRNLAGLPQQRQRQSLCRRPRRRKRALPWPWSPRTRPRAQPHRRGSRERARVNMRRFSARMKSSRWTTAPYVYRMNERTTGSDFGDMQRYLRALDRPTMTGIEDARGLHAPSRRTRNTASGKRARPYRQKCPCKFPIFSTLDRAKTTS